jgi:hypothetical protein
MSGGAGEKSTLMIRRYDDAMKSESGGPFVFEWRVGEALRAPFRDDVLVVAGP